MLYTTLFYLHVDNFDILATYCSASFLHINLDSKTEHLLSIGLSRYNAYKSNINLILIDNVRVKLV